MLDKKIKLAILGTRGIPASYGGFETFAQQLAIGLVQRGHQVTVYAETDQKNASDTWFEGVRIRYIRRPRWGAASVIAYDCHCLWDARREYDLVYMLGYGAAWFCWLPRVFDTPVWINVDGLEWARSKWGRVARLYLRWMEWCSSVTPSRVLADAQAIADHYKKLYPKKAPCSFIAYGAVVPEIKENVNSVLSCWGLNSGRYLLVVARPEPENHVFEIIKAYLQWGGEWPLVIVGDVQPINNYQKCLLGFASDRVRFIGGVYNQEQLTILRLGAACHVHGHSVGGTNPSLLEALACRSIVIAHNNPFNREVARNAAVYFGDGQQLVEAFIRIYQLTQEQRIIFSENAAKIIEENYSWGKIISQYENLMIAECGLMLGGDAGE